ncbi:hypothetical protein IL38_23685 [Actinopolyspora erythraea]|uniref:Uncharacterized protein n=1 Tax=Actinopolyspora erythraea TaxID=414996 RepID=A0ABR4WY41_9ACTN|nr:hypothetical protein [Actinopolyspora erythraea]KGI79315.1 hypothetical protein IL38_23685 [Actinopolyspora erythraea]
MTQVASLLRSILLLAGGFLIALGLWMGMSPVSLTATSGIYGGTSTIDCGPPWFPKADPGGTRFFGSMRPECTDEFGGRGVLGFLVLLAGGAAVGTAFHPAVRQKPSDT